MEFTYDVNKKVARYGQPFYLKTQKGVFFW